jgi:hypothetical protein
MGGLINSTRHASVLTTRCLLRRGVPRLRERNRVESGRADGTSGGSEMIDGSWIFLASLSVTQIAMLAVLHKLDLKMRQCRARIDRSGWRRRLP